MQSFVVCQHFVHTILQEIGNILNYKVDIFKMLKPKENLITGNKNTLHPLHRLRIVY